MDRSQVIRNILNSDENRLGRRRDSGLPFAIAVIAGFIAITVLLSPGYRNTEAEPDDGFSATVTTEAGQSGTGRASDSQTAPVAKSTSDSQTAAVAKSTFDSQTAAVAKTTSDSQTATVGKSTSDSQTATVGKSTSDSQTVAGPGTPSDSEAKIISLSADTAPPSLQDATVISQIPPPSFQGQTTDTSTRELSDSPQEGPEHTSGVSDTDTRKLNDLFPPETQQENSDRYFRDGLLFAKAKEYIDGTNGREQDYSKALPILNDLITRSSSSARFELAKLYRFGFGVPQDMNRAVQLYREGAHLGNQDCQCSLGALYYKGNGVTKSYTEAVKYFSMAAKLGDRTAQFNLGCSYLDGTGVGKDLKQARQWLEKSAAQNYKPAKSVLKAAFPQ